MKMKTDLNALIWILLTLVLGSVNSAVAESVSGTIVGISNDFGNLETSLTEQDVDDLGLSRGASYTLLFKDKTISVHFGTTYSDVEEGKWISFINDLGQLRIARNFENAAQTLNADVGDKLTISNE